MRYHTPRLYNQSPRPAPTSLDGERRISASGEGVHVTRKKKKRRAPPAAENPPPGDAPSSPPQSAAPEVHATPSPPFESMPDSATVGTREENQRLLAHNEEGEDGEAQRVSPGYDVNEESDEFRNVWG